MDIEYYLKGKLVNETIQGDDPSQVLPYLVHKYSDGEFILTQERGGKRNTEASVDLTACGVKDVRYKNEGGHWVSIPEIDLEKAPNN